MKEVVCYENCNADDFKEWQNSDEILKITESTTLEMIEDEEECNYTD